MCRRAFSFGEVTHLVCVLLAEVRGWWLTLFLAALIIEHELARRRLAADAAVPPPPAAAGSSLLGGRRSYCGAPRNNEEPASFFCALGRGGCVEGVERLFVYPPASWCGIDSVVPPS